MYTYSPTYTYFVLDKNAYVDFRTKFGKTDHSVLLNAVIGMYTKRYVYYRGQLGNLGVSNQLLFNEH